MSDPAPTTLTPPPFRCAKGVGGPRLENYHRGGNSRTRPLPECYWNFGGWGKNVVYSATEPLALHHSWPLYERARHFGLGHMMNCAVTNLAEPTELKRLGAQHAGLWVCDLADNSLVWSGGVYDIFGLPRGAQVTRDEAAALYSEESGAAMECLRAHAIAHRRGFTLDVDILPVIGEPRRIRLIAAPVCEGDRVVRLHGLKLVI